MLPPEERMRILLAETQRLEQFLTALPEEAWTHSSACSEWCVADVVAHLISNSANFAPRILRALQGDSSPDDLSPRRARGSVDPVGAAQRIVAFRKQLGQPEAILPAFIIANRQFEDAMAMVGSEDWYKPVYRPAGPEPVSNIVDVELAERIVHGWDIRSQFDPSAALRSEAVSVLVERIAQRPRWWSFREGSLGLPVRYRFQVTSPKPYSADVVVTEREQYMEVGSDKEAQVTFRCDGETYVMLMYGRTTPGHALAAGLVSAVGDRQLVTAFAELFTGG